MDCEKPGLKHKDHSPDSFSKAQITPLFPIHLHTNTLKGARVLRWRDGTLLDASKCRFIVQKHEFIYVIRGRML